MLEFQKVMGDGAEIVVDRAPRAGTPGIVDRICAGDL